MWTFYRQVRRSPFGIPAVVANLSNQRIEIPELDRLAPVARDAGLRFHAVQIR